MGFDRGRKGERGGRGRDKGDRVFGGEDSYSSDRGGFGGGGGGGFGGGGGGASDPWSTPAGPSDEPPF